MSAKRLLYLNTHRLAAYAWQQGKLAPEGVFEPTLEDHGRFADYLRRHAGSPFFLLCNVAEEGHQVETIPFLHGKDRQAVISRRTGQLFFGTPLSTALSMGYEKNRRKNERVLLAALTNPGHIQPWLTTIASAEVPLAGVYTLSQLGGQLLKRLGSLPERCLLLTHQDHSVRGSFMTRGTPVFSRMTPLNDSSVAGIAAAFAADAEKLHQYLAGQRQVGRNETLPVYVVCHPQGMAALRAACIDTPSLQYVFVDGHEAAKRVGLAAPPDGCRCDHLFLQLLAAAPPRQQYLGDDHRHEYHLHLLKRGLLGAGAVALLGGLLFAGKQVVESHLNHNEAVEYASRAQELQHRYQQIAAGFPQLGINDETLRRVAGRYHDLQRLDGEPGEAYRHISHALDQTPANEVDAIDWRIGNATSPAATGRPAPAAGDEEIAILRGTVRLDGNASPRQVLAAFDQFVERLRAPGVELSVLQRPFDIESGRSLKGGGQQEGPPPRAFTLRIVRKLPT